MLKLIDKKINRKSHITIVGNLGFMYRRVYEFIYKVLD